MQEPKFISMSDDEYFDIYAVSSSGLRCFATEGSWIYYKQFVERSITRDYSDALRVGHAVHQAVELGDEWLDLVYRVPEVIEAGDIYDQCVSDLKSKTPDHFSPGEPINKRSPIHRNYLRIHKESVSEDMISLSEVEIADIELQRLAIQENGACHELLTRPNSQREVACFRSDTKSDMLMKCKIDVLWSDLIVDIKSTRKTVPHQFVTHAVGKRGTGGLGYHYQSEWYQRVTGINDFKTVVVSKSKAPEAWLFSYPEWVIDQARDANDNHFWSIANCHLMDSWHTTGHGTELPIDPSERIPL